MKTEFKILIGVIMLLVIFGFVSLSFGANVSDNNSGNAGYIFISAGGHIGHWTDITTIPSLKGAKGDKGDTGATGQQGIQGIQGVQGIQGLKGDTGLQGIQGIKGDTGLAGKDGLNGTNGIDGLKGDKGDTGANGKDVDPAIVTNLQNEDITLQSNINGEAVNRVNGDNLLDTKITSVNSTLNNHSATLQNHEERIGNLEHRVGKLEQTQYKIEVGFRVFDSKRLTITPFMSQDFTRGCIDEAGVRITVKLGKSYEEKLIEKQNLRLSEIEKKLAITPIIEKVVDIKGHIKSISINANGLNVNGDF